VRNSLEPHQPGIRTVAPTRVQALNVFDGHHGLLISIRGTNGTGTRQGGSCPSALRTTPHFRHTIAVNREGLVCGLLQATDTTQSCSRAGVAAFITHLLNVLRATVKRFA
jgi:hypothetical protein